MLWLRFGLRLLKVELMGLGLGLRVIFNGVRGEN